MVVALTILALLASATVIVASNFESKLSSPSGQETRLLSHKGSSAAFLSNEAIFGRYDSAYEMINAFSTEWMTFYKIMDSEARAHCCAGRNATTQEIFNDIRWLLEGAWAQSSDCELPRRLSLTQVLQHVVNTGPGDMRYASICALLRITASLKHALPNIETTVLAAFEQALIRPALNMVTVRSVKRLSYACGCSWMCSRFRIQNHLKQVFDETEVYRYIWCENLALMVFFIISSAIGWLVVWECYLLAHNSHAGLLFSFIAVAFVWLRMCQFPFYYTVI